MAGGAVSGATVDERAKERKLTPVSEAVTSVVITGDSKWVYAGTFDGKVHVWEAAGGKVSGEVGF